MMEYEQVEKLIEAVSKSDLTELEFEKEGVKLSLKKERRQPVVMEQPVQEKLTVVEEEPAKQEGKIVKSPFVGIFYEAPAEDAAPFVQVGDHVENGQVLAIVEAMKLMNEIDSEYEGTVSEVLAQNGQMVEYGQPLFRIL